VLLQSRLPYFNIDNSKAKRAMAAIRSIGQPAGHRLARAGLFDSVNLNNTNAKSEIIGDCDRAAAPSTIDLEQTTSCMCVMSFMRVAILRDARATLGLLRMRSEIGELKKAATATALILRSMRAPARIRLEGWPH
jgi:hypothetical protein